ncbi:calcium-binding protein [Nocardioides seonyuensis]|nr:calcium-binding protein [Nocardioides seonyuensis]
MNLGVTLLSAAIALACGVGTAHAAPLTTAQGVATLASGATFHLEGSTLVYTASPGVNNYPFVAGDAGSLLISDPAETMVPGAGCVLTDPPYADQVLCPMPAALRLELGDGEDRDLLDQTLPSLTITVVGGSGNDALSANNDVDNVVTLDGGDGDDVLNGMRFADTLLGGAGKDALHGNGGDDALHGGDGDDHLEPDTYPDVVGNDLVDGGPGFDSVQDWASMTTDPAFAISVTVDGLANDGRPSGERDNVIAVERFDAIAPGHYGLGDTNDSIDLPNYGTSVVLGNAGADTITGNDGTETIDGGAGDDTLEGGYGHDTITGGPGRDTIFADETSQRCSYLTDCVVVPFGNDLILARDGEADVIDCGVGDDRAVVDPVDTATNCEEVDSNSAPTPGTPTPGTSAPGTSAPGTSAPGQGCVVPKRLKGLTLRKARKKLQRAHCTTTKVRKVASRKIRKGRVVSAEQKGAVVIVRVSRGRR